MATKTFLLIFAIIQIFAGNVAVEIGKSDHEIWGELKKLREHYEELRVEGESLKQENSQLVKQVIDLQQKDHETQQLLETNSQLQQQLKTLERQFDNFELNTRTREEKLIDSEGLISFTAYNGLSGFPTVSEGINIPFPNIVNNDGGHFNISTSAFTCPVRGLYHFSTSILSYYTELDFELVVGEDAAAKSRAHTFNDWGSASASVTIVCNASEEVSVVSLVDGQLYGDDYSSFTGYLITELTDGMVGFTADYNRSDNPSVSVGQNIPFPNVIHNDGTYYDPATSSYRCPSKGLYFFSTTIVSETSLFDFYLSMEGQILATSRADTDADWGSTTTSATVFCDQNQRVSVISMVNGQIHGERFCSFTGFLITVVP